MRPSSYHFQVLLIFLTIFQLSINRLVTCIPINSSHFIAKYDDDGKTLFEYDRWSVNMKPFNLLSRNVRLIEKEKENDLVQEKKKEEEVEVDNDLKSDEDKGEHDDDDDDKIQVKGVH